MSAYDHKKIEEYWQKYWEANDTFRTEDNSKKEKFYGLVEFPYPSGVGLHVGHVRAYTSLEVIARKRRLEGFNVLFPIGWDAFGLPTENYAIKTGRHPREVTDENIAVFTDQLKRIGYSFDWSKEIDTTDPKYYKWTQWIFLQLFKHGLAFRDRTYVNFCNGCKVVLANEDFRDGKCDRCGSEVVQMEKDVWFLKIRNYAERLLDGLDEVDYLPRIRLEQENWIGKSVGAEVEFAIAGHDKALRVFTTRPDTLFGATFMVIAPEHPLIQELAEEITNMNELVDYQDKAKRKTEFERVQLAKDKTGVRIQGVQAINPVTHTEIPIFLADYVMMGYGTGAIMAVPGHDNRDWEFAKKFDLPIIEVIKGGDVTEAAYTNTDSGEMVNSGFLNGLEVKDAIKKTIEYLEKENLGKKTINYKMKDWAFNRQRYWGEPIPIIHCPKCGMVPVPENELPLELPIVESYEPTDNGKSPLANIPEWYETTCPVCGGPAERETDTMPQWAGSSWYFLRYFDNENDEAFASEEKMKYWLPVDWYNGGMEHVTRHLLYSRFWHQFLYDIGCVPTREPYAKRTAQGLILGNDGDKMSKSKGNVVNPNEIIDAFGADTLRTYILFIGDYEKSAPWSDNGAKGCRRFLDRVWKLQDMVSEEEGYGKVLETAIHKTIKKVNNDYEEMKYNTAIAALMTLLNDFNKAGIITKAGLKTFILLLYPVAPHITSEIWQNMKMGGTLDEAAWPQYDESKTVDNVIEMAVQINGKVRGTITLPVDADTETAREIALNQENILAYTQGKTIVKEIYVPGKIFNIVVK
ncbi:leucine--tRNA ligase [Acetobacterium paludosum]|uniref:Leucine--tRNA ligase n=1 Tax=Acetobacterium paludosum TaxID=52693 RepID=A0A923KYM6_9FIRM|nr:leucine--tRNA ligase [Acetobacterium paludosum]MBC3889866.1 leucine--tRNA ligase [Acetobacterium paludosum]